MTVKEFIDNLKANDKDLHNEEGLSFLEVMATQTMIWDNAACKGYAAAAAKEAGFSQEDIIRLLHAMRTVFEEMSVDEAEQFYNYDQYKK